MTLPRWHTRVFPLILAFLVLTIDQVSKLWIRNNLMVGESMPEEGLVRFTRLANQGIILGLDVPLIVPLVLSVAAIAAALLIFYRFRLHGSALIRLAMGLFVGGALGNLVDRLYHGHVTDFIDVQLWGSPVRPVSNPADICIMIGILFFAVFVVVLRFRRVPSTSL